MREPKAILQDAARNAAGRITPGMSIQAQINAACDNLGYPRGHWRVRAAWYGEAENWEGRAMLEFLTRYDLWCSKRSGQRSPFGDALIRLFAGHPPSGGEGCVVE